MIARNENFIKKVKNVKKNLKIENPLNFKKFFENYFFKFTRVYPHINMKIHIAGEHHSL